MSSDLFLLQTSVARARPANPSVPPGPAGRRRLRRALAAVAMGAAAATLPARAEIVVGVFDPAFGPFIPNLGFGGTVTVDIPSSCFALTPNYIANIAPCSLGAMQVQSAAVNFYNINDSGNPIFASLNTFSGFSVDGVVTGVGSPQNELLGIQTGPSALISGVSLNDLGPDDVPSTDDVNFFGDFRLRFYAVAPADQGNATPPYYAAVLEAYLVVEDESGSTRVCNESTPAGTIFRSRSTVPEPETIALLLSALCAAAFVRHRRPVGAQPSGA